jgi:hypothetical protein
MMVLVLDVMPCVVGVDVMAAAWVWMCSTVGVEAARRMEADVGHPGHVFGDGEMCEVVNILNLVRQGAKLGDSVIVGREIIGGCLI